MWTLILLVIIATTNCAPVEDKQTEIPTTPDNINNHKTANVVSYIQHFKNAIADYVNTQYTNLTHNDMEQIKETLEQFLIIFANDLKETVEAQQNNVTFEKGREEIKDGIPDETFVEIRERMKSEFPDIQDETADEIVYKLRKNLYVTRQKIDTIIKTTNKEFEYAVA